VDPDIWCPPTFVGNSGIERSNGHRGFALADSVLLSAGDFSPRSDVVYNRMMVETSDASSKTELRSAALLHRNALAETARSAAAAALAATEPPFAVQSGMVVSGYVSVRGELDPAPLMRALAGRGARLALPVVTGPGRPLIFRAWQDGDPLDRSALGILEPRADAAELIPDIVLVPLAAFDAAGHRIGYGAGHYDCTLQHLRARRPIVAAGIAFAMQEIAAVPAAAHDVVLDFVLTERGARNFRS
jgi:5-formyltetrahydrofolate cyclo-ligase